MIVLKIGGNELDRPEFLDALARMVAGMEPRPVVVHGGGRGTTALAERLGLTSRFVDGLRVTDEAALEAAVMGLVGLASTQLVRAFASAGVPALGLSGADCSFVIAEKMRHPEGDLGRVGRPVEVNATRLRALQAAGFVPCLAPICVSREGDLLNVNADQVAQAVAAALDARALVLLTNVPGVRVDGEVQARLGPAEVERLIASGAIAGGMIPKVRAAVGAVQAGVRAVLITDLAGCSRWLDGEAAGTEIRNKGEAMDTRAVIELEQRHLAPTYKRAPVVFERGAGVYLYDAEGNAYLDFLAGIAVNVLGYGDPEVLAAVQDQAARLIHVSNLFHTEPHALLARDLCAASFADRVFFCNSGTEANEGALKFARKWARARGGPDKVEVVAFSDAFHGRSMGALSVTHNPRYREPFEPLLGGVRWAVFDDLASVEAVIGPRTAAVIVEPVQGEGGVLPARAAFLQGLRRLCERHEAALIFDEVQCGLGRTGTLWAHEPYGVTPDLMTLAKPLGGGLPIGAVLMTDAIASALAPGDHGSTFAAGPLVTRVAEVILRRVADPRFLARVREVGGRLGAMLTRLAERDDVVEARGVGLMWGLELKAEAPAAEAVDRTRAHGVVIGAAGRNTLRLVPPLTIEASHVDTLEAALLAALDEMRAARSAVEATV